MSPRHDVDLEVILAGMNEYFATHQLVELVGVVPYLRAMGEPSFAERAITDTEAYRFLWLRTRHHPIAVRVDQFGEAVTLVAKVSNSKGGYDPGRLKKNEHRVLSGSEFVVLKAVLDAAGFWSLASTTERGGLDGALWILEGRRSATHHVVVRWSPNSDGPDKLFRRACEQLTALARLGVDAQPVY